MHILVRNSTLCIAPRREKCTRNIDSEQIAQIRPTTLVQSKAYKYSSQGCNLHFERTLLFVLLERARGYRDRYQPSLISLYQRRSKDRLRQGETQSLILALSQPNGCNNNWTTRRTFCISLSLSENERVIIQNNKLLCSALLCSCLHCFAHVIPFLHEISTSSDSKSTPSLSLYSTFAATSSSSKVINSFFDVLSPKTFEFGSTSRSR